MKIHVREWFDNTVLTPAKLQEFGGNSWSETNLPLLREAAQRRTEVLSKVSSSLEKAELYLREEKPEEALRLLKELPPSIPIVHRLMIESLHALGRWDDLIKKIKRPMNSSELSMFVDALCRKGFLDKADQIISECEKNTEAYDDGLIKILQQRVNAERIMIKTGMRE